MPEVVGRTTASGQLPGLEEAGSREVVQALSIEQPRRTPDVSLFVARAETGQQVLGWRPQPPSKKRRVLHLFLEPLKLPDERAVPRDDPRDERSGGLGMSGRRDRERQARQHPAAGVGRLGVSPG